MNFKKRVNGSWHDTPHYVHKTATDTITTLPAVLYPNDTTATVGLKGQTVQNGTQTPDSPVMPQGTGERTGNLFDGVYSDISGTLRYRPIFVGDGTFTLSTTTPYDSGVANVFLLSGNVSSGASTPGNGAWKNHNVTAQSVDGYVTIAYRHYSGTTSPVDCQTMLNIGSTALPYEPYGYKIPISSANTTTPVYLAEVQTTRKIYKRVFNGTETGWRKGSGFFFNQELNPDYLRARDAVTVMCTHYQAYQQVGTGGNVPEGCCSLYYAGEVQRLYIVDSRFTTLEDFTTYLAQQYAAGTPVTVWYVLAEPETAVVNEPLMKIGDYADEVSNVATIPTIAGANTISIGTTLQPSEVTVNYKGWHPVQNVHERDNGAWT